jgi:hypothetical protein
VADTPRPTHLDFSGLQGDVIELGQTSEPPVIDPEARRIPAHRPVADAADIERAAAAVTAARRVAIVAGDGAAASRAGPEILALAEVLAAPVATTLREHGIIPTRHRLSAGVAGRYSSTPATGVVECNSSSTARRELGGSGVRPIRNKNGSANKQRWKVLPLPRDVSGNGDRSKEGDHRAITFSTSARY